MTPRPVPPAIAVEPRHEKSLVKAVESGGGRVVAAAAAEALVWTAPRDAAGLGKVLDITNPKWVQLPFAGIESFFEAGVIDEGRLWTCAKGIYGPACAEHALTLMLAAARRIHEHVRVEGWRDPGFGSPERRLSDLTVLIFGTGGIGGSLVHLLEPFGTEVISVNRRGTPVPGARRSGTPGELPSLLAEADFVVVAAALTPETRGLFDRAMLEYMKDDAWIVNVARGGLIVTDDLVAVLQDGGIGGAALDVTDPEPLPVGHPLWRLDNVIITPHVANTWDMALPELAGLITRNVRRYAAGETLESIVDPRAGY